MNKKFFSVILLAGVFILMGAGCGQKPTFPDTSIPAVPNIGKETQKPESEKPTPKTTGKVTDEQCIDVLAHQLWASQLLLAKHDMAVAMAASQKAEALQKKYGIDDDDFENICNAKVGDMDFMDNLENRMKKLGFIME